MSMFVLITMSPWGQTTPFELAMATASGLIGLTIGCQISLAAACFGSGAGLALILFPAAIPHLSRSLPISSHAQGELK